MSSRTAKAKLNIASSLLMQLATMITGLILPQVLIRVFGSTVYGATTSIASFLSYISLVEGGMTGVARAALYKPLAENDTAKINGVYCEIVKFFRIVAIVFIGYTLLLACGFQFIANENSFEWVFTFLLTIVISISTLSQYFFGIANSIFLYAEQKVYIDTLLSTGAVILNTVLAVILVNLGCDIIIVKLASGLVYFVRPLVLSLYVKRKYRLKFIANTPKTNLLSQKWAGMGQHIAYFLHFNTAIAVLTLFANLTTVAVYSIYNMVVTSIRNFSLSFASGMEAAFGSMYARGEKEQLKKSFGYYETLISVTSLLLFSVTFVLIVPFVKLYTAGMNDSNYIYPLFAALLVLSELIYCLRIPYHYMTMAANHFKQTQYAAYAEAAINIIISVLLVGRFGLIGVAFGTLVSNIFRYVYYAWYLSMNIIKRHIFLFVKRLMVNCSVMLLIIMIGNIVVNFIGIDGYWEWLICGSIVAGVALVVIFFGNFIFYKEDMKVISSQIIKRKSR